MSIVGFGKVKPSEYTHTHTNKPLPAPYPTRPMTGLGYVIYNLSHARYRLDQV